MIINCDDENYKIKMLAKDVAELILAGISSEKILILTLNSFKKEKIIAEITDILLQHNIKGFSEIRISTFSGIVYNSVLKNWVNVEKIISKNKGETAIIPTLNGLDATQYFFRKIIKEEDFEDYFSKKNLMHQLLRRYKLITENSLTDNEINEKSLLLNETFGQNALKTINTYKLMSTENRMFDNLKQISAFMYLLKNNLIKEFDNVEYFFADDADEYTFAAFEFCKYMIKKVKHFKIFLDKNGCSRKGYLCGYDGIYDDLKKEFHIEENNIETDNFMQNDAENIYKNIAFKQENKLINFTVSNYSKRLEMIEAMAHEIISLIDKGIKPYDIQIITPCVDENLFYSLKEFFKKKNIKLQFLTGNKKITEDLYVYGIIIILELLNSSWGIKSNGFDIRILLNEIIKIPVYECKNYIEYYNKHLVLPDIRDNQNYNILFELINDENIKIISLKEQFDIIFQRIIAPNMLDNSDFEPINLLAKSINEFEKVKMNFSKLYDINLTPTDWLIHIKNSVVSQNPSKPAHLDKDAIIVSTPQKIVDFSIKSDYQIWLDTTSNEWLKDDTGTIYNSWVFQKNYEKDNFTAEINHNLTLEKTAKLIRKLTLCANKKILTFSSIFDVSGRENYGEFANFIATEEEKSIEFKFIPRDDQAEILNYSNGKLAVPAVPGAGKTTVMLALLIELTKRSINPQNILVLTFMESAARNFISRYKKITSQKNKLPHISTIHAFAYKILSENNNYALVNLPEDFSVCDDGIKISIIKEICANNLPCGENLDDWSNLMIGAISKAKINNINNDKLKQFITKDTQLKEFLTIYDAYIKKMKDLSLLDYDDLLVYSVKLLENNPAISEYYQNKFQYIIEDEAQDSTAIQQKLIQILSSKNNNVIRSGDVNQAILSTFSNSDMKGFKEFISTNKKVEMFRSQRCTKDIYELANSLIDMSKESDVTKDAFYDLKMRGVEGKNPVCENAVEYKSFSKTIDEKEFVLNDIREKLKNTNSGASFAILLRTNKQVSSWASFIEQRGLNVICRGDSYKQKKVFTFILSALELFLSPWDNKIVGKFYKEFCNIDKCKFNNEIYEYIVKNENTVLTPEFIKHSFYNDKEFEAFWWDAFSIAENHTLNIQEIVIYCANNYFDDIIDKSNAYLFSVLIKRYTNTLTDDNKFKLNYIPEMIKYFKNLFAQKTLKGINLFAKEDEDENMNGFVQIMTVHKAKGAEFDYVYLPEFNDYNYSTNFSNTCRRIEKNKKPLLSKIDKIITGKDFAISQIAKREIAEALRLIYVAITRAKKGLYILYSEKNEFNKDNKPIDFFEEKYPENLC